MLVQDVYSGFYDIYLSYFVIIFSFHSDFTSLDQVLDEFLRAVCGFKGTEDPMDDRFLDTPFTSDCARTKKISSAPSYGVGGSADFEDNPEASHYGCERWCEAIEKYLPLALQHPSAMVGEDPNCMVHLR